MTIPKLNNIIKALDCDEWRPSVCKNCLYGYYDTSGDSPIWKCNEEQIKAEALFYLKLYQYLIKEEQNE